MNNYKQKAINTDPLNLIMIKNPPWLKCYNYNILKKKS